MASNPPTFSDASETDGDEARWEAYRALLRKSGDAQALSEPGPEPDLDEPASSGDLPSVRISSFARAALAVGAMMALGVGVAGAVLMINQPRHGPSVAGNTRGLTVQNQSGQSAAGLRSLPCFVDGRSVGLLPLEECGRRNGVAGVEGMAPAEPSANYPPPPRVASPPPIAQQEPMILAGPAAQPPAPPPSLDRAPSRAAARGPAQDEMDRPGRRVLEADSVSAVREFYAALADGDGDRAAAMVVPEQRRTGHLSGWELSRFYASLREPLRLVDIQPAGAGMVHVRYEYVWPDGDDCFGAANVWTTEEGGEILIRRIRALNGC